jgi:hypothetical protein
MRIGLLESIPPEQAAYRFVATETFDGELCDVVESARRAERLWISRKSGLLRGLLIYFTAGPYASEPFFKNKAVEKIAGRSFANQTEYANWAGVMSYDHAIQIAMVSSDTYAGLHKPNELVRFRDYREVAPGVWVPFREDRVFTHSATSSSERRKFIRLWAAVQEVRVDIDLTETIERLKPKDGDVCYRRGGNRDRHPPRRDARRGGGESHRRSQAGLPDVAGCEARPRPFRSADCGLSGLGISVLRACRRARPRCSARRA